jgi:RNA polymerase sigma-70 factor (ECF subfamily)
VDETERPQQVDPRILRLARLKGRELSGKYGFARHDAEDIQQELILDYLQRLKSFDAKRCHRRTFAHLVINNRVRTLIATQKAACRDYRVCQTSLDQTLDRQDDPHTALDRAMLSAATGLRDRQSTESKLNLRLDVEGVLLRLPPALVKVCSLVMMCDSAMDVALRAGISRATLYRRLHQVRRVFADAGWVDDKARSPT